MDVTTSTAELIIPYSWGVKKEGGQIPNIHNLKSVLFMTSNQHHENALVGTWLAVSDVIERME
jgi:hypothetical protein